MDKSEDIVDSLSQLSVKEKLAIFEKSFERKDVSPSQTKIKDRPLLYSTSDNNPSSSTNMTPKFTPSPESSDEPLKFVYDNEKIINQSRAADPIENELVISNIFQNLNNYIDKPVSQTVSSMFPLNLR